ncbi:MAG: serine/threonine protein kinase [Pyrinomonadaceae bacterium]
MKQLAPNTMIQNRYLVVQPIGKGGMGEVYLAVDQRLGSAVALKRTIFEADNALGSAFEREAKILARLRHPVLPKVIDHFIDGEGQFLVMEHISGDDLAKRLESAAKPFPLSWVMFWADQLLDALNYLHSHEPPIIHRDIKPQNLKLTDDNHIVLLDFGLSKDFDSTPSKANEPPGTGSVVGYSPHFASMEQIRGTGTDARSDLYSMSATLYQLLTNGIPPDALTRADAILGGQDDPIAPINSMNREATKEISDVILKGLSVRQDQRFATAAEMQKALRRAFNNSKNATISDAATIMNVETDGPATAILPANAINDEIQTVARIPESTPGAEATARIDLPAAETEQKQSGIETAVFPSPHVQVAKASSGGSTPPATPHQQAVGASTGPPPQKKSRAGLIIGALFAMMLLGGLAVGGGWYWYTNYYAVKPEVTPSPVPSVRPSVSPTPGTTQLVETSDTNSDPAPTPARESDKTDTTTTRDVTTTTQPDRQTQPSTKATPPRTTKTPTAKATPKPKGDDRTVILQ